MKIDTSNFSEEINKILEDYTDEVAEVVDEVVAKVAEESKKEIRKYRSGRKRWKEYPKGWEVKIEAQRLGTKATVYNSKHYQLTHLLEFGHATRNGGRTAAFPHISIVNDFAQKEFERLIKEKLS